MRRLLALLLLLLGGCALLTPTPELPPPSPLSSRQWQDLEARLRQAPRKVLSAIRHEAQGRLASPPQGTLPKNDDGSDNPEAILADLILHSRAPLLLADDSFRQRLNLVDGSGPQPQTAFAQALAGFLLQHDYSCRHPVFSSYFQARYQLSVATCKESLPFLVASRNEGLQSLRIAPERLHAIHLLFAGQGGAMASRFGHVALRLIICPEGDASPEACNSNLYGHLVLGYMAHVDEFELNTVKALSGQYKAHLFAFPFMDAYRGYAIDEFREIFSVPLALDKEQLSLLLRQLDEIHWRYEGDYSFFRRNCATLLQDSLRLLDPGYAGQPTLASDYLRPDSFFEAIIKTPLVEGQRLTNKEQAEEDGYYFSSTEGYYEQAMLLVRKSMTRPSFADIESYLARPPAVRINDITADQNYFERLSRDQHLLEAQILLEELAIFRSERRLLAQGSRYFHDFGDQLQDSATLARLEVNNRAFFKQCFLQSIRQVTAAVPMRQAIPDQDSPLPVENRPGICKEDGAPARLNAILHDINQQGNDQWQRILAASRLLEETVNNILVLQELNHDSTSIH